jgi:pimeloyl-ACP methyl ester carboxylesterase
VSTNRANRDAWGQGGVTEQTERGVGTAGFHFEKYHGDISRPRVGGNRLLHRATIARESLMSPSEVLVSVGDIELSALTSSPGPRPARGIILCLHGGGSSARYWNNPTAWGNSFLELAAHLGFHALAVDRPGYGRSKHIDLKFTSLTEQIEILFEGLDRWCDQLQFSGPRFVIGHSVGGILATMMAAHPRSAQLSACDGLGVALRYTKNEASSEIYSWESFHGHVPRIDAATHRLLCFGADGTFAPASQEYDYSCYGPMPSPEYVEAMRMAEKWPEIMPTIRLPIQLTNAQGESMMEADDRVVEDMKRLLRNSVLSRVELQRGAGHDATAHHVGVAYHLRAIAFFEEVIALRTSGVIAWP